MFCERGNIVRNSHKQLLCLAASTTKGGGKGETDVFLVAYATKGKGEAKLSGRLPTQMLTMYSLLTIY